jgi:dihydrofolate reductase
LFACDALLLGRVTYEAFAKAWPSRTDEAGFADRMNNISKFVVSTTMQTAGWKNSTIIKENIAEEVTKLRQQSGKDILVAGSGKLVKALMDHDLVDEYRIMVHPIVVGGGRRLFGDGTDRKTMELVETKTFKTGTVVLVYQPKRNGK